MTIATDIHAEILPGYRILDRLGAGGYGEVWRVEAPGGLTKAIKIVHGFLNERHATDELKALERIKGVRHPFLLSLERFEITQDRLVIITELADESLRDRFDHYVSKGKNGIPRDELVDYLRDAADALDYMSEVHQLQHLDIKPENLLLVAGHVKVADFGLVKEIQATANSLVCGLTPYYAAPEVFEGKPSLYSDQYGLAALFQHMLTGTLPFMGSSVAELTLQHLHEEPNLSPLSAADQEIIRRALLKNPAHRYPSSREMIDRLRRSRCSAKSVPNEAKSAREQSGGVSPAPNAIKSLKTEIVDSEQLATATRGERTTLDFVLAEGRELIDRPTLSIDPEAAAPSPTLFVGVGGTGARVLRAIKRNISECFGNPANIPSFAYRLIDTDSAALLQASHGSSQDALSLEESLAAPLRRPQEYRESGRQHLQWLSRRWIYNIPRSLRTEGLRPLGRLAFADHVSQIEGFFSKGLQQIDSSESRTLSSQAIGQEFQSTGPRVVLIASTCGGTGGGMSLDVAYLLRQVMGRLNLECPEICGFMLHCTPQSSRLRELALVNSYAWLTEYNHYNRPGAAFPGDAACRLEPLDTDVPAFDNTYLMHLGDHLPDADYESSIDNTAECILMSSVGAPKSFFAACQQASGEKATDQDTQAPAAALRTVALAVAGQSGKSEWNRAGAELAQQILNRWGEQQNTAAEDERYNQRVEIAREQLCDHLQLDHRRMRDLARRLLIGELRATPQDFLQNLLREISGGRELKDLDGIRVAIDRLFGGALNQADGRQIQILRKPLSQIAEPLCAKLAETCATALRSQLDDSALRVRGTVQLTDQLLELVRQLEASLQKESSQLAQAIETYWRVPSDTEGSPEQEGTPPASSPSVPRLEEYFMRRLDHCVALVASALLHSTATSAAEEKEGLSRLGRRLRQASAAIIPEKAAGEECSEESQRLRHHIAQARVSKEPELLAGIDSRLQEELLNVHGGLYQRLNGIDWNTEEFAQLACTIAGNYMAGVLGEGQDDASPLGNDPAEIENTLRKLRTNAQPTFAEFGGNISFLAALPQGNTSSQQQEQICQAAKHPVQVLPHFKQTVAGLCEADNLPLRKVAQEIIRNRRDYAEYATRVLTRKDVPWSWLSAGTSSVQEEWNPVEPKTLRM